MESDSCIDLPDLIVIDDDSDPVVDDASGSEPNLNRDPEEEEPPDFLLSTPAQTGPPFTRQEACAAFDSILRGLLNDHDGFVHAFLDKADVAAAMFEPSEAKAVQACSILFTEQQLHGKFIKVVEKLRANMKNHPILIPARRYFEAKVLSVLCGGPNVELAEVAEARKRVEELREKKLQIVDQQESELASVVDEEEKLDAEIAELTARLESMESSQTEANNAGQLEKLQSEMSSLERAVSDEKSKSSRLIEELKQDVEARQGSIDMANAELQRLRERNERAARTRYRTDEQSRRHSELSDQIHKIRSETIRMRQELSGKEKQEAGVEVVSTKITQMQGQYREALTENSAVKAALEQAKQELAAATQKASNFESRKTEADRVIRNAEAELEVQGQLLDDLLVLIQVKTGTEAPTGSIDEKLAYVDKHLKVVIQQYQELASKESKLSEELSNFLQTFPQVECLIRQKDEKLAQINKSIESTRKELIEYAEEAEAKTTQFQNFIITLAGRE